MAKIMAEQGASSSRKRELQYLNFVRVLALNSIAVAVDLYEMLEQFIKMIAGPSAPLLRLSKRAVSTLLVPFYNQFKGFPFEILYFFDILLDQPAEFFGKFTPTWVKLVLLQRLSLMESVSGSVAKTVHKARMEGFMAAVAQAVLEFYRLILSFLINIWFSAIKLPLMGGLVGRLLPAATGMLNKYSKGMVALTNKGFSLLTRLPLVDQVSALARHRDNIQESLAAASGRITEAIQTGAAALNPLQVVREANKVADTAAAVAGETISNAVGMGSTALNAVAAAGEASLEKQQEKIEQGIAGVKEKVTDSLQKGGRAIGEAGKVASAAISAAGETASFAAELGATAFGSVLAAGDHARQQRPSSGS